MVVHCSWNTRTHSLGPNALPSAWNSPGLPGSHLYSSLTLNPAWYEGISSVIFLFSFHSHKWSAYLPAQAAAEPGPGQFFWEAKPELCAFLLVRTQHGIPIWMYKELGKSFVYSLDRLLHASPCSVRSTSFPGCLPTALQQLSLWLLYGCFLSVQRLHLSGRHNLCWPQAGRSLLSISERLFTPRAPEYPVCLWALDISHDQTPV